MITKYRTFSTEELLNQIEMKRAHSPLIDELCDRLESVTTTCPVCECDIGKALLELE